MLPTSTEVRRQLTVILGGVILIVLITLIPDLAPPSPDIGPPVEAYKGVILEIIPPDRDPGDAGGAPVFTAQVQILEGALSGQTVTAFVEGPGGSQITAAYAPGDEVVVTITQDAESDQPYVAVADRWRFTPIAALIILFALGVTIVGGWQGVRALTALGLTIAVILKIILPLILQGVPPLPMAVVGATAITAATILLTEGWGKGSAAAILGTAGSLSVAGLIAAGVTAAAQFTYTSSDLAYIVTQGGAGLDLRGILLAAIILGSLGVLDDVTVTQAVVVDELAERGSIEGKELFRSALGIGRSHIGATVNTLFLAYVGASLPLLVVLLINNQPTALIWNNEEIATEIVRTLAGSLGIVAAVPLTTFVAVLLVGSANRTQGDPAAERRTKVLTIVPVVAICAVVVVLLGATAILPRTGPSQPLPTEAVVEPAGSDEIPSDEVGGAGSGEPGTIGDTLLAEREEAVDISVDGGEVGTASVDDWTLTPGDTGQTVVVSVTYAAKADWALDPGAWEILTADGTELPLVADPPLPSSLAADQTASYSLTAETDEDLTGSFIAYVDTAVHEFVFVVSLE
ncbi:MAG TPA: YibE/F family protein [Candidatus Limnocylindrales bacterium]|nr:YibE/F family protein [Candidatus Limnocylindrales bacterium]